MRTFYRNLQPAFIVVITLLWAACGGQNDLQIDAEIDEPHFRRGQQEIRSGRNQVALQAFLKVIEKRSGEAPESHFKAGELYLNHIKDPIAAIYHLRKFLEIRPNGQKAPLARQMVNTAKKEFARTLPAKPLEGQMERLDLMDLVDKLKKENESLKVQLATSSPSNTSVGFVSGSSRSQVTATHATRPVSVLTPAHSSRRYVVTRGDTLYRISVKVYGSGNRWRDIFETNRSILGSPNDLKVGTELVIP
ncbi:MAG: LysM peptidoglycan-binding domain-containing protein [Opitutaceae bacterium]|nr:LysM peptidoglycan-binding domain-containing protein [Opitutaceae bacterium]